MIPGAIEADSRNAVCVSESFAPSARPLGFYILSLLIVEGTIGLVLTASKLSEERV